MAERSIFDLDVTRNNEFAIQRQGDATDTGTTILTVTSFVGITSIYAVITYANHCDK